MKNIKIAMLVLVVCLSSFSFAFAQVENDTKEKVVKTPPPPKKLEIPPGMEEEWEAFKERYGDAFTLVKWDRTCGCVRHIYGYYDTGRSELRTEEESEELATKFLLENAGLFKIDMANIDVSRIKIDKRGVWKVDFAQKYQGIPVYKGEVRVIVSNRSQMSNVINNFYPGINISTTPKITKKEAVEIVLKQKDAGTTVNETGEVVNGTLLYVVLKTEDGNITYHLTWRVPTHTALYFINAKDGSIVLRVQTAFPSGEDIISETTRNSGSIGSVSYGTFTLALLKKFWIPIVLLILIFFVVWRRKR